MHSAIAEVDGVTNCVAIDADYVGALTLVGPGAGERATASSVVSDIADIAKGDVSPAFARRRGKLQKPQARGRCARMKAATTSASSVYDRHGAFAAIATSHGRHSRFARQHRPEAAARAARAGPAEVASGKPTPVVLITHETTEAAIRAALDEIIEETATSTRSRR